MRMSIGLAKAKGSSRKKRLRHSEKCIIEMTPDAVRRSVEKINRVVA